MRFVLAFFGQGTRIKRHKSRVKCPFGKQPPHEIRQFEGDGKRIRPHIRADENGNADVAQEAKQA